jgi:hypothetical protein
MVELAGVKSAHTSLTAFLYCRSRAMVYFAVVVRSPKAARFCMLAVPLGPFVRSSSPSIRVPLQPDLMVLLSPNTSTNPSVLTTVDPSRSASFAAWSHACASSA